MQVGDEGTPALGTSGTGAGPKTPWRTPPPAFAEVQTPATAVAASGWQQHYDGDEEEDEQERADLGVRSLGPFLALSIYGRPCSAFAGTIGAPIIVFKYYP